MTHLLIVLTISLHVSFLCGQFGLFYSVGKGSRGTRLLELSATACVLLDIFLLATRNVDTLAVDLAAIGVALLSAVLYAWAGATIRRTPFPKVFSAHSPSMLVTSGPYRYIRNPFYTAYLLAYVSTIIATMSLWAVLPFCWMAGVYLLAVLTEEKSFRESSVSGDYSAYYARTGRFLPIKTLAWAVANKKLPGHC